MGITLPSVLAVSGSIVDANGVPQAGFKVRAKLLSVDGSTVAGILAEPMKPLEAQTAADGGFSFSIQSAEIIKQLLTQGAALLFKSAADDLTDTPDAGLSRSTPLHLSGSQSTRVLLEWQPKRTGDASKPSLAARLRVVRIWRGGQERARNLTIRGRIVGPQGQAIGNLGIQAGVVVPSTGQSVAFPQPDRFAAVGTSSEDGRFSIEIERAGDLLPYHPYSMYGFSFRASQELAKLREEGGGVVTPKLCFLRLEDTHEVRLCWDNTNPASPTLRVLCVVRNGHECAPDESVVEALGALQDSANKPLVGYRVQVQAGTGLKAMGEVRSGSQGYFPLMHPAPLSDVAPDLALAWKLRVLDPSGKEVAAGVSVTSAGLKDAALPVKLTLPVAADGAPTLAAVLTELKATIDAKTQTAIDKEGVKTLLDVIKAGGLRQIKGTVKADEATLTKLEQAADLWSLLPDSVSASDAVKYIVVWITKGFTGTALLGSLPRAEATKALAPELGDYRAAQLHHVAAARNNLLNHLLLQARLPGRAVSGGVKLLGEGNTPLLLESLESSCSCEECRTAVSPNAYLVDLARYGYVRVRLDAGSGPVPIAVEDLQAQFHQPFADLPQTCSAMEQPVLVARLAVEVLRSYATTRPALDPSQAALLATAEGEYRQSAYDALLSELGTSRTELSLAAGDDDQLTSLADRLGLPSKTEAAQLLLNSTQLANEDLLESRFGLRKSTRAPLDNPTTDPELLTWRQTRQRAGWLAQDRPVTYPTGVPILDPDVLHSSNLRLGWDSTHDTTTVWAARRAAVNTELTNIAASRALAVGAGVITVSQAGLGRAATDDESWAAYLVVNLSDDEVQSMAATLPLSQQDQARQNAADRKVLLAKRQRTGNPAATLSTDEQTSINAILTYTGTALNPKAQTESAAWIRARFEGLTPTSGSALTEAAWGVIYGVLKGTDTSRTLSAVKADLARFNFAVDAFLRGWEIKLKLSGQGFRAIFAAEWSEFDAIFVARWKVGQVTSWVSEEATKLITVSPDLFWVSPDQPAQPLWLGSPERYGQWLAALQSALADPIVDATLITSSAFVSTELTDPAYALHDERSSWLATMLSDLVTRKGLVEAAAAGTKVTEFDDKLLSFALRVPKLDTLALAWYEPGSLQQAFDKGSLPSTRLEQLLLFREEFNRIFRVRSLLRADKAVSELEWSGALSALFIAQKRRKHGAWRLAEAAANISLSPVYFKLPTPPPLQFPPQPNPDDNPRTTLRTKGELLQWRSILSGRIEEQSALGTRHAELIDRVEQAVLPALRDALLPFYTPTPTETGVSPLDQTEWMTDRLLLDFADGPASKTTRVAHAITTLQQIFFGLRSGQLFRQKTSTGASLYPKLTLEAENFDKEWRWMGSYGSWRSALFIFMYPENLLHPTLRPANEKSEPFTTMVSALQQGGTLTPDRAKSLAQEYGRYFNGINYLSVAATCTVTIPLRSSTSLSFVSPDTEDLVLLFGVASTGEGYWAERSPDFTSEASQSLWRPIPVWKGIRKIYGAVPFRTRSGRHLVSLIAKIASDKGGEKLQVLSLDLGRLGTDSAWDTQGQDLDKLPESDLSSKPEPTIVVEQVVSDPNATRPPHVYVGVLKADGSSIKMEVYRRPLDGEARGWSSGDWPKYLCTVSPGCTELVAGFCLFSNTPTTEGYAYIALYAPTSTLRYVDADHPGSGIDMYYGWSIDLFSWKGVIVYRRPDGAVQALLIAGSASILMTVSGSLYLYQALFNPSSGPPSALVWDCSEGVSWTEGSAAAVPIATHTGGGQALYTKLLVDTSGLFAAFDYSPISKTVLTADSITLDLFAPRPAMEDSGYRKNIVSNCDANNADTPALLLQLYEAFYAVPIHMALQLQQAGYHQEALDWYRLVYDHTLLEAEDAPPYGDRRKIYYGLVREESISGDEYLRTESWLLDPFNPHAVAALRNNAYTRFVLQQIISCMLDYADSLFATDTAETLPKARTLYLRAQNLLRGPELDPSRDCTEIVAEMDFSFVPEEWQGEVEELSLMLSGALGQLPPSGGAELRADVLKALKDTTVPKWGTRFAKAKKQIHDALAKLPKPPKVKEALKAERSLVPQAQLGLLAVKAWRGLDARIRRRTGRRFRTVLSGLTGVAPATLDSTPSLAFGWLSKSVRTRGAGLDPGKRNPVLVQPESAIGAAYKQRLRWDPLRPNPASAKVQALSSTPAFALAEEDPGSVLYLLTPSLSFCIPPNPTLRTLTLRSALNLYKLRTGRDITGIQRSVDFFAAPTDAQTGLPSLSANGGLAVPSGTRLGSTEFRYSVLIERARRLAQLAAQFEGQLLQTLEKIDAEARLLLDARNNLNVARASLNLRNLEVQEANLSVDLASVQITRNTAVQDYLQGLLNEYMNEWEKLALQQLMASYFFQLGSSIASLGASVTLMAANSNVLHAGVAAGESLQALASYLGSTAALYGSLSSISTQMASYERRYQGWLQDQKLAQIDSQALNVQLQQASTRVQIKQQETRISQIQLEGAEAVVDFLVSKFTNKELYEWMSRVLQGLYAAQLQQATATARLAQQQLAFDLLQDIDVIRTDYWTVPVEGDASGTANEPDRRGLTGSARLLRDIEQLDGLVLSKTERKLQLIRTISLATFAPGEFQRLKENGEMWFETRELDFDREFPGHYFRRIHRVRVSVLALVPPSRGIRATLRNVGPSRVVVPGVAGFEARTLPPSHDEVALSAPQNASGLFELDAQPELRLPFEGVGVDTLWHFELPKPSNFMDYGSIADILVTIEYTALSSADYRAELLQNPAKLPPTFRAVRVFSFRNELVDAWYTLHNPPLGPTELRVQFPISAQDFPAGLSRIQIRRLTLYMPVNADARGQKVDLSQDLISKRIGLGFGADSSPAKQDLDKDHLIQAQGGGDNWFSQIPSTLSPFGTWVLVLPATQQMLDLLRGDLIQDILFAVTYEADLPSWPTGLRPKTPLF